MGMQGGVLRLVSAFLVVLLAGAASADEVPGRWTQIPLDVSGEKPSPANCTVVTSDCEACAFRADGTFACSTPGIACVPTHWTCMQRVSQAEEPRAPR